MLNIEKKVLPGAITGIFHNTLKAKGAVYIELYDVCPEEDKVLWGHVLDISFPELWAHNHNMMCAFWKDIDLFILTQYKQSDGHPL